MNPITDIHIIQETKYPCFTVTDLCEKFNCSSTKIDTFIKRNDVHPVGTCKRYTRTTNLYELTPQMEEYLSTQTISWRLRPDVEEKRKADGWFTVQEIADKWDCSYVKALDILLESKAEYKWEGGGNHLGRKFFKIPKVLSRDPFASRTNHKMTADWLDSVPDDETKDLVLSERKWKKAVGKRVVVKTKKGKALVVGELTAYNMVWFSIKNDVGSERIYMTREAEIAKEVEEA